MNDETQKEIVLESDIDDESLEIEDYGDEEESRSDPFNPKDVDIQVTTSVMDTIIKRLQHDEIELTPDFQRSPDLWGNSTQSRLIESLLINVPIPAFYFDASNDESWEIVDGLQRLSTIKNFVVDKKLKLVGVEFLKEYEGYNFDGLPRTLQRRIEEFPITLYLIKPGTPAKMKYSLFNRINTGGLKLRAQEIRHAISQGTNGGRASKFLMKLTESDSFCRVVSIKGKRMSNCELILRHLSFVIRGISPYRSSMVNFLDEGMEILGNLSMDDLEELENSFLQSMDIAWELFNEHAFKKSFIEVYRNKVVNKPLFEALSAALAKLSHEQGNLLIKNKSPFLDAFEELMKNSRFYNSISRSTANTDSVKFRFEHVNALVQQYVAER